jgi:hypothetical protein|tara:strand:- start:428 stop:616 length:189 start_codon:yes stop_codon:yes gene_type:complete
MSKRRKKVLQTILQAEQHNPTNISYRGEGLSNEYRLSFPVGLAPKYQASLAKRVPFIFKKEI